MGRIENDFDFWATRYDVGFAQQVADHLDSIGKRDLEFVEAYNVIKTINDIVGEIRQEIKDLFTLYRAAKHTSDGRNPLMRRVYANHKTILLRRQISDHWKLYQMARSDSRELTKECMRQIKAEKNEFKTFLPTERQYRAAA